MLFCKELYNAYEINGIAYQNQIFNKYFTIFIHSMNQS